MLFERIIKYIDYMENGEKVHNAGFVSLLRRDDIVDMQVQVEKLHETDTIIREITLSDGWQEQILGELKLERGRGSFQKRQLNAAQMAEGITYENLSEIKILLSPNRSLCCVIREPQIEMELSEPVALPVTLSSAVMDVQLEQESEDPVSVQLEQESGDPVSVQPERESEDPASVQPEQDRSEGTASVVSRPAQEDITLSMNESGNGLRGVSIAEPIRPVMEDKWQQLCAIYPHIQPFHDSRDYLSVRPEDFVILSAKSYPVVSNSFLLHGYYNYEHLILTKVSRRGMERYYIGVPGNFYEKEKQVALLYGFESFECQSEPAAEGDFGYYMHPVEL